MPGRGALLTEPHTRMCCRLHTPCRPGTVIPVSSPPKTMVGFFTTPGTSSRVLTQPPLFLNERGVSSANVCVSNKWQMASPPNPCFRKQARSSTTPREHVQPRQLMCVCIREVFGGNCWLDTKSHGLGQAKAITFGPA